MNNVISKERVSHPLFGEIDSVITEDGKVWYKGKDVATALGYKTPSTAIKFLKDSLSVMTEYRTGLGYTAKRPYTYIGKEGIKALIIKRATQDVKKRMQESIRQIELI